jgi:hypothetical protein
MAIAPYKTKDKPKAAKTRGTRDRMPQATITTPTIPRDKGLVGRVKDALTSDKEKKRRAMSKQSTKKVTYT